MVYFFQAGISSGYQEKPCLDPSDSECPPTAPNKLSGQVGVTRIKFCFITGSYACNPFGLAETLFFLVLWGMEINGLAQDIISLCCGTRKHFPQFHSIFVIFFSPFIFHFIVISFISLYSCLCISAFLSFSLLLLSFPITSHVLSACLPRPPPNWHTFWGGCVMRR